MLTIEHLSNLLKSHELLTHNIQITTITSVFKLKTEIDMDIENIKKIVSKNSDFFIPKQLDTKKIFKNCISLMLPKIVNSKRSWNVKLFTNGSVQMTGCKNEHEMFYVIQKLNEANIIQSNQIDISSIKIALINTSFDNNFCIPIDALCNQLNSDKIYTQLDYGCIRFRINLATTCILPNNKILLSGRNSTSILESYKFITEYLTLHYNKYKILKKNVGIIKNTSDI
jgi:TATA-box binding protein (TBP) (component of TFIID and TFIIIB)